MLFFFFLSLKASSGNILDTCRQCGFQILFEFYNKVLCDFNLDKSLKDGTSVKGDSCSAIFFCKAARADSMVIKSVHPLVNH